MAGRAVRCPPRVMSRLCLDSGHRPDATRRAWSDAPCRICKNPLKTRVFGSTDRRMAARMGKSPHERGVGPHGTRDCPHGLKNRPTERKTGARMGRSPHGIEVVPHETANHPHKAIFHPTDLDFDSAGRLKLAGVEVTRLNSKSVAPHVVSCGIPCR